MRISDWSSDVCSSDLLGKWKPSNYSKEFYGPTPMRVGLEKSRNLMTVRLAQTVGMAKVADYARRFGVVANLDPVLSMALGAGETRSEERRVGNECVSTCRSLWSPHH